MSQGNFRILCSLSAVILASSCAFGQAARSPFSSYGLGEQVSDALTQNQGMAGVGVSQPAYFSQYINNLNPALLIYNRVTSFQAGLLGEQRTQTSSTQSEKSGSGNLSYLVLAIPIKPGKWTSAISLLPYSRLNYQLNYTKPIAGSPDNTLEVTEEGNGGVNQASFSNGITITRRISVGLKATYLFSSIENSYLNSLTTATSFVYPRVLERTFVSDFRFSPALSYHVDSLFKKDYRFNFGIVYDFSTNLRSKFNQTLERRNGASLLDSITLINNQPGRLTIPQSVTAGISFGRSYQWMLGLDGTYTDYSQYRDLTGSNPYGSNYWRVGLGFEITPDIQSLSSYLKRATYRTGLSMENAPYLVNGNNVKDLGITFGLSAPVSRGSSVDIALKVGKKGDKSLNTVEENYIKFYFGITFNDQWFIKRKFD